ncbi:MAG: ribonuclease HII [Pseudomonadota bacterium]|nr:ribonuclease HII [Pseudomonadota bacterium]
MFHSSIERELVSASQSVAGVDEVGRGCLAGSVFAAYAVLDYEKLADHSQRHLVRDSKTLSAKQRGQAVEVIDSVAKHYAVGIADVREIESKGIVAAVFLAMHRALSLAPVTINMVLVDGRMKIPTLQTIPQRALVGGDKDCLAIAAASVLAKVARDNYMRAQGVRYPGFGFEKHVGYGTAEHLRNLRTLGVCDLHRRNFAPIKTMNLGNRAEELVANAWQRQGWRVLARNYRGIGFEIDLITQRGKTLVFVEVKARSSLAKNWQVEDFISERKRSSLQRGAEHFIASQTPTADHYRFDLCIVVNNHINVLTDVFVG